MQESESFGFGDAGHIEMYRRGFLGAVTAGSAAFVGGPTAALIGWTSVASAQSANPDVLSLIATVRTAPSPIPAATLAAITKQLSAWNTSGNLAANVASLFNSAGAIGSAAGIALSGVITNAVVQASTSLGSTVQSQIGTGIGRSAVALATAGYSGSANSVLSTLSNNPAAASFVSGLQNGVTAQLVSFSGTNAADKAKAAIQTAAAGTGAQSIVVSAATNAQIINNANTQAVLPIPYCTTGSCN